MLRPQAEPRTSTYLGTVAFTSRMHGTVLPPCPSVLGTGLDHPFNTVVKVLRASAGPEQLFYEHY